MRGTSRAACPACGSGRLNVPFHRRDWAEQFEDSSDVRKIFADRMSADPRLAFERMLACEDCGTLFTDLVPPHDALGEFYASHYGETVHTVHLGKLARKLALEKRRLFHCSKRLYDRGRRFLDGWLQSWLRRRSSRDGTALPRPALNSIPRR